MVRTTKHRDDLRNLVRSFLKGFSVAKAKSKGCPFGVAGDELWVREDYRAVDAAGNECATFQAKRIVFRDGVTIDRKGNMTTPDPGESVESSGFKSGRFLPRWASRIQLAIKDVEQQRLHLISGDDAELEGFRPENRDLGLMYGVHGFTLVWKRLHGVESWEANPNVWVIEFARIAGRGCALTERPIVFCPVMVQAILRNQKTQTRRVV